MKKVLLLSENIDEINRLRRFFDSSFSMKATTSLSSAAYVAETSETELIIYNACSNLEYLTGFYKQLRQNPKTAEIPLIVIIDINILKAVTDTIELINTSIIGSMISRENMRILVYSYFNETPPEKL